MSGAIYVINPNSTVAVTQGIDRACEPPRMAGGPKPTPAAVAMAIGRVRLGW